MKRVLVIILALVMLLSVASCAQEAVKPLNPPKTGETAGDGNTPDKETNPGTENSTDTKPAATVPDGTKTPELPNIDGEVTGSKVSDVYPDGALAGDAKYAAADRKSDDYAEYDCEPGDIGLCEECEPVGEVIGGDYNSPEIKAGTLTAKELRDLDNWSDWQSTLRQNSKYSLAEAWGMICDSRIEVIVADTDGNAQKNASVVLYDTQKNQIYAAVTNAQGKAYLFYNVKKDEKVTPASVTVTLSDGTTESKTVESTESALTFTMSGKNNAVTLDLMFMIDTTGSMGDELEYLKVEIKNVIETVAREKQINVRTSVNFYRDDGDEYIVRYYAFRDNASEVEDIISQQSSNGGGDYPEAVDRALSNAVNDHQWADGSVKLMFLVLDAPAHENVELYNTVVKASEMGIRIIPVCSSGVNENCEVMCRTFANMTGGTYVYLTDDSGIGGSHAAPETKIDANTEYLNALMIRVIEEYCS